MKFRVTGTRFFIAVALVGASLWMAPFVVAEEIPTANSSPAELRAYVKAMDEKIKAEPQVAKYYGLKGQALEDLGDYAGAVAAFTQKLKLLPNDLKGLFRRAENYKHLGRPKEALADYDKLVEAGHEESDIFSGRALVKTQLNDLPGAMSDAEKAINAERSNARAWFAKGCVLYDLKSPDRGVACFSESIRIDPLLKESWSMRSKANLALGKVNESKSDRKRARLLGWPQ